MAQGSNPSGSSADWILSGAAAAGAFLVSYLFIDLPLLVSIPISVLFLGAGLILFRMKKPETIESETRLENALEVGKRKLDEIEALKKAVRDRAITAKVDAISGVVRKILAEVKRDPADLKEARQFLTYYLDATINILRKYVKLTEQDVVDQGIRASLDRVESMLDTIRSAFEKQLARLLSNDVMDLDAELALLEKTIKMEGLGE